MANKLMLRFNGGNFPDFIQKLQELSSIDDVIKVKIDINNILLYSIVGGDSIVLALKSYILQTSEYIENFDSDETFDLIITQSSKLVKSLKFLNTSSHIKLDLTYKPMPDDNINHIRSTIFSSGRLKISNVGGEWHKIRDMNISKLTTYLDPNRSKWSFSVDRDDFMNIKKLCSINNDEKILNINVVGGEVIMSESSRWDMIVDNISGPDQNLIFGKKYLQNINLDDDRINFSIFETFILVKDKNSNLMMSFEQSWDD